MCRDFDSILNCIIVQYEVDKHHPNFRKYLQAADIIREYIDGKKILLIGEKTDICIVTSFLRDVDNGTVYTACTQDQIQYSDEYAEVLLIAYQVEQSTKRELQRLYGEAHVEWLYDLLEKEDIHCDTDFYDVLCGERWMCFNREIGKSAVTNYFEAIYRDKKAYKEALKDSERRLYLERIIFGYAYIRDFLSLRQYIYMYCDGSEEPEKKRYTDFWHEVERLLEEMRSGKINQDNLYMYWIDGLGYGEEAGMEYLIRQADESICFENAYTAMATTSTTMKLLFLQKMPIGDKAYLIKKIEESESELLLYLRDEGYKFCYCGSSNLFEDKFKMNCVTQLMPCTMLYWKVLCDGLMHNDEKKFYLMHELAETHWPFMSGMLEATCVNLKSFYTEDLLGAELMAQREVGKQYFDRQLEFYDSFFSPKSIRIFMSDHGSYPGLKERVGNTHTIFYVKNWETRPRKIEKVFSYLYFTRLVKMILGSNEVSWSDILNEYAVIEDLDKYAYFRVEPFFHERKSIVFKGAVASRGIVTENGEKYIRYSTGEEYYFVKPSVVNRINVTECQNRIDELRKYAGDTFINVFEDDFFKCSRIIYQIINIYRDRIGEEEPGITLLRELVAEIDEDKVIAIRGGGEHTVYMLGILGADMHRIRYIVDKDTSHSELFDGPGFRGKIITPSEMKSVKVDVIILSSFNYRDEMRKELEEGGKKYQIIDIYKELELRGIAWECAFYETMLTSEEIERASTLGSDLSQH